MSVLKQDKMFLEQVFNSRLQINLLSRRAVLFIKMLTQL